MSQRFYISAEIAHAYRYVKEHCSVQERRRRNSRKETINDEILLATISAFARSLAESSLISIPMCDVCCDVTPLSTLNTNECRKHEDEHDAKELVRLFQIKTFPSIEKMGKLIRK